MELQTLDKESKLKAYWWNKGDNFGDVMNPVLLRGLTGLDVEWSDEEQTPIFSAAGSIIDKFHTKPNWSIWGGGVICETAAIPEKLNIHAIRGPKTKDKLERSGYKNIPEIYGDPGLLLPIVLPCSHTQKAYDLGIIPHTSFRYNSAMWALSFKSKFLSLLSPSGLRVKVISPKLPVNQFISEVNKCRAIAANSLHGLIIALAYKIPCRWIHFENDFWEGKLTYPFVGDRFKYDDFLGGVESDITNPIIIRKNSDWHSLLTDIPSKNAFKFDPKPLLDAFPYKTAIFERKREEAIAYFRDISD